jgi:serine/threonine-protein kinase
MGDVYRAHDTRLRRDVALKVITAGAEPNAEETVASALREARLSAAISHPHVAAIYDVERIGDTSFIVMEHVVGQPLRRLIDDASLPLERRLRWLREIAEALACAHELGVVHRDVKPENVMISDEGDVKMVDFGIARRPRGAELTGGGEHPTPSADNAVVGTPAYMPPEQIHGLKPDGRADQFAWGVLAYELLTGALPWRRTGGPYATLMAVQVDEPAPFPPEREVPVAVGEVVLRAMAKSPVQRFPSMNAALLALAAARSPPRAPAQPRPTPRVAPPPASPPPASLPSAFPAASGFELLGRGGNCLHLACGNVLVNVWLAKIEREDVEGAAVAGRELSRRFPAGIGSINVFPGHLPMPDAAAREAGAVSLREAQRWMLANAVVIEGSGFWASAARAVYSAIQLAVISQCPQAVFGDVTSACAWLPTKMRTTMRDGEIAVLVAQARAPGSPG